MANCKISQLPVTTSVYGNALIPIVQNNCTCAALLCNISVISVGTGGITSTNRTGNNATSAFSTASGGQNNSADGIASTISGGYYNLSQGKYSTVSGGYCNQIFDGNSSTDAGVFSCDAAGVIGGGICNTIQNCKTSTSSYSIYNPTGQYGGN